jgi:hypothetical protein
MSKASLSAVTLVTLVFSAGLFYSVTHINNLENRTNYVEKTLAELVGTGKDVKVWTSRNSTIKRVTIRDGPWDEYAWANYLEVPDMSLTIFLSNKSIVYVTYTISIAPISISIEGIRIGVFVDPKYDLNYGRWGTPLLVVDYSPHDLDALSFHVTETLPPGTHTISLFWHDYYESHDFDVWVHERAVTAIAFPTQ